MTQAIVFDFDGVLHNTFELHLRTFNYLMRDGEFTADDYRDLHDGNIYENTTLKHKTSLIDFSQYGETIRSEFISQKIDTHIKTVIKHLSDAYSLFIISSGRGRNIMSYLEQNGLGNAFVKVLGREVHESKIKKFHMVFDEYNLSPDNVIFITDTLGDILEGNEVGVKTIAVDFGFHERERLKKGNPYAIISSFDELENYLVNN